MPWKSEAQRRYMWANHPEIAKKFEEHTTKEEREKLLYHTKKDRLKKTAEVFADFLSEASIREKVASDIDLSFSSEDLYINKYAGIALTDPSPEGVEQFIKYYMSNELSFFPEKIDVKVEILPLEGNTVTPGGNISLENATGVVHLLYNNADIMLPYMIRDRELLPFDVLQIGKERGVYTRNNLKKVLFGIQAQVQQGQLNNPFSPYKGVDKHINQLTDHGFMRDVLRVQELATNYPVTNSSSDLTASELIDDLLEKVANLKPVDINYTKYSFDLQEQFRHEEDKIASIEETEEEKIAAELRAGTLASKYLDVHHVPTGANVMLPDKDGSIILNLKAKVFKEIIGAKQLGFNRVLMITIDNRFADIRNYERTLVQVDDNDWDFKTTSITGIKPGYMYTGLIGGGCMVPFMVKEVTLGSQYGISMKYAYNCIDIDGGKFIIAEGNMPPKTVMFMSKDKAMGEALKNDAPDKICYYDIIFKKDIPIMFLPQETEFIELRGVYDNTVKNVRELTLDSGGNFNSNLFKVASSDGIRLSLFSRDDIHTFSLDINWTNREHTPYVSDKANFNKIDEGKVRGILKTLGMEFTEISDLIFKAQHEGTAWTPIKPGYTPQLLRTGANAIIKSNGVIDNLRKAFFNRENAIDAGAALVGGAVGGVIAGVGTGAFSSGAKDIVRGLGAFADESKSLAIKLEKLAMLKKSPTAAKLAKLMIIKNGLDTMVKQALEGSEYEVNFSLAGIEPELSNLATQLMYTKVAQLNDGNEIISPNVIQGVVQHLDGLFKYAQVFNNVK